MSFFEFVCVSECCVDCSTSGIFQRIQTKIGVCIRETKNHKSYKEYSVFYQCRNQ